MFALLDPTGLAPRQLAVSEMGLVLLSLLDGRRDAAEVAALFNARFEASMAPSEVMQLVQHLDAALLMDSPRARTAYDELAREYAAAPARDNTARWPPTEALSGDIEYLLSLAAPSDHRGPIAGLIAPHLDYPRGAPCYAEAYALYAAALKTWRPERFVVLGTNHFGSAAAVCATTKDFATPFGIVPTDRAFVRRLEGRLGQSLCEHELDHRREHSIEIQVHILQHLHRGQPIEIVPVLCPDPSGPTGTRPRDGNGPDLGDFADALCEALADDDRATLVIASADLSHMGQSFGDEHCIGEEHMQTVGRFDQQALRLLEAGEADAFMRQVSESGNATRICSVGCLYVLSRALRGRRCRVLRYHQASDYDLDVHVTCAAGVVA